VEVEQVMVVLSRIRRLPFVDARRKEVEDGTRVLRRAGFKRLPEGHRMNMTQQN
jgi:hypothetical protein